MSQSFVRKSQQLNFKIFKTFVHTFSLEEVGMETSNPLLPIRSFFLQERSGANTNREYKQCDTNKRHLETHEDAVGNDEGRMFIPEDTALSEMNESFTHRNDTHEFVLPSISKDVMTRTSELRV